MSEPLTLLVPAEEPYRALGVELARKYVELAGGSASDGQALAESLERRMAEMAASLAPDAEIALVFRTDAGRVEVQIRGEAHSAVVAQPVPARKSS